MVVFSLFYKFEEDYFMLKKVKAFFSEIVAELKKVSWSTKEEVVYSTSVVIIATAFITVFIGFWDLVLAKVVDLLMKMSGAF